MSWVQVAQPTAQPVAQSVAQSMAQPCSARRASLVPSPRQGHALLYPPPGCGSDATAVQVMPGSRVASLRCLLLLLRCLPRPGLTGSARCPGHQGHRPAPRWHHGRGHGRSWAPLAFFPTHAQPQGTKPALFVEDEEEHHHEQDGEEDEEQAEHLCGQQQRQQQEVAAAAAPLQPGQGADQAGRVPHAG